MTAEPTVSREAASSNYWDLRRERVRRNREKANQRQREAIAQRAARPPMGNPQPGFWLVRLVKGGPSVAACIVWSETTCEPDYPENDMTGTRSRHLAAFVLGEPVAIERVWHWRGEPISEAEYRFQCANAEWAKKYSPNEPIAKPNKPVDLSQIPLPFSEDDEP